MEISGMIPKICKLRKENKIYVMSVACVKNLECWFIPVSRPSILKFITSNLYGGVLKRGYPQIIDFNKIFHFKPSILGQLHLWTPPYIDWYNYMPFMFHDMFPVIRRQLKVNGSQASSDGLSRLSLLSLHCYWCHPIHKQKIKKKSKHYWGHRNWEIILYFTISS